MSKTVIAIAVSILLLAASFFGGWICGRNGSNSPMKEETVRTVILHDTTRQILPIPTKEYVYKDRIVEVPVWDTVHVYHTDTLYIGVPYETKEYRDSNYFAKVGGYRPELLEIETYGTTKVTEAVKNEKTHSVYVSMSAGYSSSFALFPAIGYEYRLERFAVGGEVGYDAVNTKAAVEVHLSFDIVNW